MARFNVRCSREKCKARAVFAQHPDSYKVPRKCAKCGGTQFRVIKNMARETGAIECTCAGYQWGDDRTAQRPPHRRGSRYCHFRSNGESRQPGDSDFEDPHNQTSAPSGADEFYELASEAEVAEFWGAELPSVKDQDLG